MSDVEDRLIVRMEASLTRFENQMARATRVAKDSSTGIESRFDRMNKGIATQAQKAADSMTRAQQRIGDVTGITRGFSSASDSAKAFEKALSLKGGVDAMQASLDPLYAAQMRYQASLAQVETAVKSGAVSQKQAETVLGLLKSQYDSTAAASQRLAGAQAGASSGMSGFMNISGGGRFVLQNTAAQLGDIAVQMEMGTATSRVMAQQLPQLLGGFGALGGALGVIGPLLGTVAAVGIPVAAMLLSTGDASDDAKKKVKGFADALDQAEAALSRAKQAAETASIGGLKNLREEYGRVTNAVVELAGRLADIEKRAAKVSLDIVLDESLGTKLDTELEKVFGRVGAALAGAFDDKIPAIEARLKGLQTELADMISQGADPKDDLVVWLEAGIKKVSEELAAAKSEAAGLGSLAGDVKLDPKLLEQIGQARDALKAARDASDWRGVSDALASIVELLQQSGVAVQQGIVDALTHAEDMARRAGVALGDAVDEADNLGTAADNAAAGLSGAALEAAQLATKLREAASALAAIASGVSSLNISNIGDRARVEALEAGKSKIQANAAAKLAEERAKLAPALGSGDGAVRMAAQAQLKQYEAELAEAARLEERIDKLTDTGSKGGKSGTGGRKKSKREWDVGTEEIESLKLQISLIGRSTNEVARLQAEQKLLNEAKRKGLDLDTVQAGTGETLRAQITRQAAAIGELTQEYDHARERADLFEQSQGEMKSGMIDAILEGKNLSGVLEGVAKSFARAALEAALFGSGPFGKAGGAGLFGSIGKAIFGGRAAGGAVSRGTPYTVGENGREVFVPAVNGQIISNVDARKSLGGAGTTVVERPVSISVNVDGASGDNHVRALVHEGVASALTQYDRSLPSRVTQIQSQPRFR